MFNSCFVIFSTITVVLTTPLFKEASYYGDHAEEQGDFFEGDMILSDEQLFNIVSKNVLKDEKFRWPDNTLIYSLSDDFSDEQKSYIKQGLDTIAGVSCVKFREKNDLDENYVLVSGTSGKGCSSAVGYKTGVQNLNLSPNDLEKGCFRLGTIMHEFLHALGVYHQQSADNRDDYVEIIWDNIKPSKELNFQKYSTDTTTQLGVEYDYDSVMHYPKTAFTSNGKPTIVPKKEDARIGQRMKLSEGDIAKLKLMHNC
ncbi:seminal metalloprotease 1-like [Lutzomyia longipalpis]|uniref:seminal metalloprotease 1-like n=1 Tax=Lutzomyia longipalpis TaxID=7200 RepID=UPI002483C694|nr:seminal metalloprotease 1-like [Lutzomyia longipalpis]